MMKRKFASQVGEEVDIYFDHLTRVVNVHQCGGDSRQALRIHIDRVNDTICDCCDGSDEPAEAGCPKHPCGEASGNVSDDPEEAALDKVRKWMRENGIVSRVAPRMIEQDHSDNAGADRSRGTGAGGSRKRRHRGMVATEQIKTGDVLMRVPQRLVLSRLSASILSKHAKAATTATT